MHRAVGSGNLKIVELLLSKGAEVDSRDRVSAYNNLMSLGYIKLRNSSTYVGIRILLYMQLIKWLLIKNLDLYK